MNSNKYTDLGSYDLTSYCSYFSQRVDLQRQLNTKMAVYLPTIRLYLDDIVLEQIGWNFI